MKLIVQTTTDEEHKALRIGGKRTFSVRISLSIEVDQGEVLGEQDAVIKYQEFMDELIKDDTRSFAVYSVTDTTIATLAPANYSVQLETGDAATIGKFKAWLATRKEDLARTATQPGMTDQEVGESQLTGYHVLMGAAGWPAPLPQSLGLTFVVSLVDDAPAVLPTNANLAVIPLLNGQTIPVGPTRDPAIIARLEAQYAPPIPYTSCHAYISAPVDGNTLLNNDTGFFETGAAGSDEAFALAVRRIEQRAGSLFTGYTAVSQIEWEIHPKVVTATKIEDTAEHKFQLGCLAWQAATTLCTAFDTIFLSLLMPGRDKREGQLLAPFLSILADEFDKWVLERKSTTSQNTPSRSEYRNAIRAGIKEIVASKNVSDAVLELMSFTETDKMKLSNTLLAYSIQKIGYKSLVDVLNKEIRVGGIATPSDVPLYKGLATQLTSELAALHEKVLSEDGTERAVIRIMNIDNIKSRVINIWVDAIKLLSPISETDAEAIVKAKADANTLYSMCLDRYERVLSGGFNGAEAARQSVGSLIADISTSEAAVKGTPGGLKQYVGNLRFWELRLANSNENFKFREYIFDTITLLNRLFEDVNPEAKSDTTWKGNGKSIAIEVIKKAAGAAQVDALDQLFPPETARFVPDPAPAPILVPITLDTAIDDDNGNDVLTTSFAGIGVLVRENEIAWAHACLADVSIIDPAGVDGENTALAVDRTIAPLASAIVDARRELFISYSGVPFTSDAFRDLQSDFAEEAKGKPFYGIDYPDEVGTFKRLPLLAYGKTYDFAAFVVGRSGLLPDLVRGSTPWTPKDVENNAAQLPLAAKAKVSRRTAIGRIGLNDAAAPRIGRWPEDVFPLSSDYPRLCVEPGINTYVFRNGDGAGTFRLPAIGTSTTIRLTGIEVWESEGGKGQVTITIGYRPNASITNLDENFEIYRKYTIAEISNQTITIKMSRLDDKKIECEEGGVKQTIDVGTAKAIWMRLSSTVSISLDDPNQQATDRPSDPRAGTSDLLLIGAKTGDAKFWRAPFAGDAEVEISFPRMSFHDFMRWTNNAGLVDEALGLTSGDVSNEAKAARARFDRFRELLLALEMDRQANPSAAKWVDTLPDLAVEKIALSVTPVDSLIVKPGFFGSGDQRARTQRLEVDVPKLGKMLEQVKEEIAGGKIVKALQDIDRGYLHKRWKIRSTSTQTGDANELKIGNAELTVPGGLTVRLSARSMVPTRHFQGDPSIIDPRLVQYAVGERGDYYLFTGIDLTIESMIGPLTASPISAAQPGSASWQHTLEEWASDRRSLLTHVPAGLATRYHLDLSPDMDAHWQWRQVGKVTTNTQAWRFGGRPIYSWIDPWEYLSSADEATSARQATLYLRGAPNQRFKDFEEELFGTRDDEDARPRTVRLAPLGSATRLVEMVADERKGATLHRHALVLTSRYAGAMADADTAGTARTWTNTSEDRWARIAVLARRPESDLTRPQLRALVPLTRRPEDEADQASLAPPVLAMLQEEPLAYGGLAARILSEIRTGIGFQFQPRQGSDTEKVVAPKDARRELGPDPRLSYSAFPEKAARSATLPQEGPIGLTFDSDRSKAAYFANTAFLLQPMSSEQNATSGMTEYFVCAVLRRVLDPSWLIPDDPARTIDVKEVAGTETPLALDRGPLLIKATTAFKLVFRREEKAIDAVKIDQDANTSLTQLKIHRSAIDATVDLVIGEQQTDPEPAILCEWKAEHADQFFLVTPGDKGRLSICALLSTNSTSRRGAGRAPVVLGSVDLTIMDGADVYVSGVQRIDRTAASAITAQTWVKTNPDFDKVVTVASGFSAAPVSVGHLIAKKASTDVTLSFAKRSNPKDLLWIRSAQSIARTPTHTQRHMVAFVASTLRGLGRDIEKPMDAYLIPGAKAQIGAAATAIDTVRLVEIETPARFAAWMADAKKLPPHYKHAYFDLVSIGHASGDGAQKRRVLFRLRQVGPDMGFKGPLKLTIHMLPAIAGSEISNESNENNKFVVDIDSNEFSTHACSDLYISFDLTHDQGLINKYARGVRLDNGDLINAQMSIDKQGQNLRPNALAVSVSSVTTASSEAWFEVSMLVSSKAGNADADRWRFDFDWLFGATTKEVNLETFASNDSLSEMTEAQARVIAVSPRIDIL